MNVVVVGPQTVRGPRVVDVGLVSVALDCIDDELALVDDDVVRTERLWRDVLQATVDGRRDGVVLVCPSWWPAPRVALLEEAAGELAGDVIVLRRVDELAAGSTVVEMAPELVLIHTDTRRQVIARTHDSRGLIDSVVACLEGLDTVTIDVPSGVSPVAADLSRALRRRGVEVTVVDDHDLIRRVRARYADVSAREPPRWRALTAPRTVVLAGATLAIVVLVTAGLRVDGSPAKTIDATWLVEGRVAVEVPATWRVERITSGPGSARVQVVSPVDASTAIQLVQSRASGGALDAAAEELRVALAAEPEGVFVDFDAVAQRAGRSVVTYREVRIDRHVRWAVLLDRGVRIAIGCQGPVDVAVPGRECDRAIASAHAVS